MYNRFLCELLYSYDSFTLMIDVRNFAFLYSSVHCSYTRSKSFAVARACVKSKLSARSEVAARPES